MVDLRSCSSIEQKISNSVCNASEKVVVKRPRPDCADPVEQPVVSVEPCDFRVLLYGKVVFQDFSG